MSIWFGLVAFYAMAHIPFSHACGSMKTPAMPAPPPPDSTACLQIESEVMMADGSVRKAGELKMGDRVLGENGEGTPIVVTPFVILDVIQKFVRFKTEKGSGATLTPDHAVLARDCGDTESKPWPIKPAADLMVGDCVPTVGGGEDEVIHIELVREKGKVLPITQSGKIATGGVLVSCYHHTHQNDTQELWHDRFQPVRTVYQWAEIIYKRMADEEYALGVVEGVMRKLGFDEFYYK